MTLFPVGLLCGISLFYAWRYSKSSIDPDWAYFNLYSFTGAVYGRDFQDCKTPGVHLWYALLAKIVGADVPRVRFLNHLLIGLVGVPVFLLTGNLWAGIAYVTLANSGWLLSFHGNVGGVPAALLVVALLVPSWLAIPLWLVAVFFEPKLVLSFAAISVVHGWWGLAGLVPLGIGLYVLFRKRQWFRWVWESSVSIPARMATLRTRIADDLSFWFAPWSTANSLLYLLPWVLLSVMNRPDWTYWLPPLLYVLFILTGRVVRQNHFLPLVPWVALGISPMFAMLLCVVDWVSSGLYFSNVWKRWYSALNDINEEAKQTGEWLREKNGTLYVNGIHSGIYVYARKMSKLGMTEQVEIREVIPDHRKEMVRRWKENPPDWVVAGDVPGVNFVPYGYGKRHQIGANVIFQKVKE